MRVSLAICVVAIVGILAFFHTGSRATALCARGGAAVADGLSLWPPGTRCSGGEPVRTVARFDLATLLAVPGVLLLVFGGAAIARPAAPLRDSAR